MFLRRFAFSLPVFHSVSHSILAMACVMCFGLIPFLWRVMCCLVRLLFLQPDPLVRFSGWVCALVPILCE